MRLNPFRAIRPVPALAATIAAPPYDVVSRPEAAALARDNPLSFLHVGRAEIDLPDTVDPYDPRVYAAARMRLDRLVSEGALIRDDRPALYLYREVMAGRAQTGVVGGVHVDDYEADVIRKHERTRPDKEDDRTRHLLALEAHAEPVLLLYRGRPELDRLVAAATAAAPLYDFTTADGVAHTVWRLSAPAPYQRIFDGVARAYVADGHHRSAAAWRAARELRARNPGHTGDLEYNWFPAVLVPAEQLRILAYNRVVTDLAGRTPEEVLAELGRLGRLAVTDEPVPPRPGAFCIYLDGGWHRLDLAADSIDRSDPIRALDVSLLQERLLGPVLGIADQRTDKRIDFVGGIRGTRALAARVDAGEAALAVSLHPTTVEQLMAVADAGQVMPPKSTWFEPKLLSGLFVHPLPPRALTYPPVYVDPGVPLQ
ncbi:MAG: DUF1015 domain-containing protein [Candidatus Rokuibacteriota bacterium]